MSAVSVVAVYYPLVLAVDDDVCDPRPVPHPYQLWLAAFEEPIPDREMRVHWNLKDEPTPTLDAALAKADYLYIGAWGDEHDSEEPQAGLCPARRVFDWLYLRGTTPRYHAPIVTERLAADLIHCFATRPDDLPSDAADPDAFSDFLRTHTGRAVLPSESSPVH